jgi:hypothetical protein
MGFFRLRWRKIENLVALAMLGRRSDYKAGGPWVSQNINGVRWMQPKSSTRQPASQSELENSATGRDLPVGPGDLAKLARWVPEKEMALLVEICERAQRDPDVERPALLLCSAYGKRVARMLDQDPFPTVTRKIADRLYQLRGQNGL